MDKGGKSEGKGQPRPLQPNSEAMDPMMIIGIIVAVLVILITFLLLKKKKAGRAILIVGPSEAGKTSIFVMLTTGGFKETVTSTIPNEAEYEVKPGSKPLLIKDLPGHDRVRNKFWEAGKAGMRGIVCVVDAAGGNKGIREAAEVVYTVLTDPLVNAVQPRLLVLANKQDQPTAKSVKVIRNQLEREITTLRLTKSASLQTTDGQNSAPSKPLGKPDKEFDFDHVAPIRVEFVEGNGQLENPGLIKWLESVA